MGEQVTTDQKLEAAFLALTKHVTPAQIRPRLLDLCAKYTRRDEWTGVSEYVGEAKAAHEHDCADGHQWAEFLRREAALERASHNGLTITAAGYEEAAAEIDRLTAERDDLINCCEVQVTCAETLRAALEEIVELMGDAFPASMPPAERIALKALGRLTDEALP